MMKRSLIIVGIAAVLCGVSGDSETKASSLLPKLPPLLLQNKSQSPTISPGLSKIPVELMVPSNIALAFRNAAATGMDGRGLSYLAFSVDRLEQLSKSAVKRLGFMVVTLDGLGKLKGVEGWQEEIESTGRGAWEFQVPLSNAVHTGDRIVLVLDAVDEGNRTWRITKSDLVDLLLGFRQLGKPSLPEARLVTELASAEEGDCCDEKLEIAKMVCSISEFSCDSVRHAFSFKSK